MLVEDAEDVVEEVVKWRAYIVTEPVPDYEGQWCVVVITGRGPKWCLKWDDAGLQQWKSRDERNELCESCHDGFVVL